MGLVINKDEMIFSIPNTEAIIKIQRVTEKQRAVGSYYLSGKSEKAKEFLNNLDGHFYVDLNASFLYCKDFYTELINNCKSIYRNELFYLDQALKDIEWATRKNTSILFFETKPPVIIETQKYLKFPDESTEMGVFKSLCVGELSEIVIQRLSINTFRIFVRPKKDAVGVVSSLKSLVNWLKTEGFITND